MTIQIILIALFSLTALFSVYQLRTFFLLSSIVFLTSLSGIFLVMYPDLTNNIAIYYGVGRGADLLFYLWITISFFLFVIIAFLFIRIRREITLLARELAIIGAHKNTN